MALSHALAARAKSALSRGKNPTPELRRIGDSLLNYVFSLTEINHSEKCRYSLVYCFTRHCSIASLHGLFWLISSVKHVIVEFAFCVLAQSLSACGHFQRVPPPWLILPCIIRLKQTPGCSE